MGCGDSIASKIIVQISLLNKYKSESCQYIISPEVACFFMLLEAFQHVVSRFRMGRCISTNSTGIALQVNMPRYSQSVHDMFTAVCFACSCLHKALFLVKYPCAYQLIMILAGLADLKAWTISSRHAISVVQDQYVSSPPI